MHAADVNPPEAIPSNAIHALDGGIQLAEEAVEVGALVEQEARLLAVAFPVLDVELAVAHVEVTYDEGVGRVGGEQRQPLSHGVEKRVFLDLFWGVHLARVHVAADDREGRAVDVEVSLEPAAGRIEVVGAELDAVRGELAARSDRDACATLGGGRIVHDGPVGPEKARDVIGRCPHLLHRQHVDIASGEPVTHAFAKRGSNAVDVDGGDAHGGHPTIIDSSRGTLSGEGAASPCARTRWARAAVPRAP